MPGIPQYQRNLTQFPNGNLASAATLDFHANGPYQSGVLNSGTPCVLTFTAPRVHSRLYLEIVQDATGGRPAPVFPGSVVGPVPSLNSAANASTLYVLTYNGSGYLFAGLAGVSSFNTRVGVVVAALGDYLASQVTNDSTVTGATTKDALNTLKTSIAALVTGVSSFKTRTGAVTPAAGDYAASQVNNDSATVTGTHVSDALDALKALIVASVTGVSSVFGRSGTVVAMAGDYNAGKITNDSGVSGAHVNDALNTLAALIAAITSAVSSWNGRTGAVVPLSNDYAASQVTNDSTVIGTGVSGAINTLKAQIAALVTGVSSFKTRTGAVVPTANDYDAVQVSDTGSSIGAPTRTVRDSIDILNGKTSSQIVNASGVPGSSISDALNVLHGSVTTLDSVNITDNGSFLGPGVTVRDTLDGLEGSLAGDVILSLVSLDGNGWTFSVVNGWAANGGGDVHMNPIGPIHLARKLTAVKVRISPVTSHGSLPGSLPTLAVYRVDTFGTTHQIGATTDPSASVPAYETPHDIVVSGLSDVVATHSYFFVLTAESGLGAQSGTALVSATMTLS